jgi:hypothetical protein
MKIKVLDQKLDTVISLLTELKRQDLKQGQLRQPPPLGTELAAATNQSASAAGKQRPINPFKGNQSSIPRELAIAVAESKRNNYRIPSVRTPRGW